MELKKIADNTVNILGENSICLVGKVVDGRESISLQWKNLSPSQIIAMLEQIKFNVIYNIHQKQNSIEDIR